MELVRKPDKRDGVYRITPADAATLLESTKKQRPLSEKDAAGIASDIATDKWVCNGETIILNGEGSVLDGQHRLRACVISNRQIESYVVHGFGSTVAEFDSLDQGKLRTASDRLAIDGVGNYTLQASIARWSIRYDLMITRKSQSLAASTRIRAHQIRSARSKLAPQIDESAKLVMALGKHLKGLVSASVLGFVHLRVSLAHSPGHEKIVSFVESVATGEGLNKTNAVLCLRNNLISRATSQQKTPSEIALALCIKAWNAYRNQRPMKRIMWSREEAFPRFDP